MEDFIKTNDEHRILVEALESVVSELGYEIAKTDSVDFRNGLKARRKILSTILKRLSQSG